jgi:hypothetical protein
MPEIINDHSCIGRGTASAFSGSVKRQLTSPSNPVLQSLAEVTTAALAGATLGSVVDAITKNTKATGSSVGAFCGLTIALVGQLTRE